PSTSLCFARMRTTFKRLANCVSVDGGTCESWVKVDSLRKGLGAKEFCSSSPDEKGCSVAREGARNKHRPALGAGPGSAAEGSGRAAGVRRHPATRPRESGALFVRSIGAVAIQ